MDRRRGSRVIPLLRIACAAALLAALSGAGPSAEPPRSAFLREWAARLASGSVDTSDFWRSVAAKGTPIVERTADDRRFADVTFLYRGSAATHSVAVVALENHQLANDRYFALARLARLGTTDIWYRTYRLRADARFTYRVSVNDDRLFAETSSEDWQDRVARLTRDPLNRHDETTRDGPVSLAELPDAPALRWFTTVPGVPAGRVEPGHLGDRARGLDRDIAVYTPPGYSRRAGARNLLIVLDGEGVPASVPVPSILDNLHAARRIDPTIAVMVANRPGKRLADLWYSRDLVAFVRDDLMPWMRTHYRLPRDPRRVVVAGRSASGSTALYLAFELPGLIGNVISQSGGYGFGAPAETPITPSPSASGFTEDDFPEKEWLTRRIATSPRQPIRIHLEVGTLEDVAWEFPFPQYATPTVLLANRHLRDVLDARGYRFCYHEYNGPHDSIVWRGTFGDALIALVRPPVSAAHDTDQGR
jgi:enterochelin esterase-like enzyme